MASFGEFMQPQGGQVPTPGIGLAPPQQLPQAAPVQQDPVGQFRQMMDPARFQQVMQRLQDPAARQQLSEMLAQQSAAPPAEFFDQLTQQAAPMGDAGTPMPTAPGVQHGPQGPVTAPGDRVGPGNPADRLARATQQRAHEQAGTMPSGAAPVPTPIAPPPQVGAAGTQSIPRAYGGFGQLGFGQFLSPSDVARYNR